MLQEPVFYCLEICMIKKLFSSTAVCSLFILACTALGLVFVFPLWKWATSSPETYSAAVLGAIALAAIYALVKSCKKHGVKAFFSALTKFVLSAGGISAFVYYVLHGQKLLGLAVLIAAAGICIALSLLLSKKTRRITGALLIAAFLPVLAQATEYRYPHIPNFLSRSSNIILAQYQEEVQNANKLVRAGKEPELNFYTYTAQKGDNIFRLSASCSVPQDSIATVNHIANSYAELEGQTLILPTVAGLYIPLTPKTDIEILLAKEYSVALLAGEYPVCDINGEQFYFIRGKYFSPEERAFFLTPDDEMTLPLASYVLTSEFGMRKSPISGKWLFHRGIDMAAPLGTDVMACKSGKVQEIGAGDYVYGNYIILDHGKGMTSRYAHLKDVLVAKDASVGKGEVIGHVGLTGLTTGPHLHFEIKLNGSEKNPREFLNN